MKKSEIPKFGVLEGVKVVHATLSTAGPFAAELMADFGADVLWIESSVMPDFARGGSGMLAESERRNQRTLSLNIPSPEGRKVFLQVLKNADIFIETSKGGQYAKWGLNDDVLWEVNPRLVIVHISGFGQDGIPEYVGRPSYDGIAQAFGCYAQLNGLPDSPPVPAYPYTADYMTALFAATSALAALHKAKETGVGESIDLAQYEIMMRIQGLIPGEFLNLGIKPLREAARNAHLAGYGNYVCKDGRSIMVLYLGVGALKGGLPLLGLEFGSKLFPATVPFVLSNAPGAELLESKLQAFLDSHTAAEADAAFRAAGVASSMVYDYELALQDPQYKAREVFVEWDNVEGKHIKGINIFPKFKKHPNRIWRGLPCVGMDNDDVLQELGFSAEEIKKLYDSKVVLKILPKSATRTESSPKQAKETVTSR